MHSWLFCTQKSGRFQRARFAGNKEKFLSVSQTNKDFPKFD